MMVTTKKSSTTTLAMVWLWSAVVSTMMVIPSTAQLDIGIPGFLEDLTDAVGEVMGGDDDDGVSNSTTTDTAAADDDGIDFGQLFTDLGAFVGEQLDNFTLPPELEALLQLPNFEDFDFSFGGNCSMCDTGTLDETLDFEGVSCGDWAKVSTLGIPVKSEQCDLIRVAGVKYCGCSLSPEQAAATGNQVCQLCPAGEGPGPLQGADNKESLGITCDDLVDAPAVDGEQTCATISKFTAQCDCQPLTTSASDAVESDSSSSSSSTTASAAAPRMNRYLAAMVFMVVGTVGVLQNLL